MSDQPISQLIRDQNLSGGEELKSFSWRGHLWLFTRITEWIVIGSIVSGQDALRSVLEKGVNKKGFLSFKSSN
jgi:hypothetical protein